MEQPYLAFSAQQFDRIFPFHFIVDAHLQIVQAGKSLLKILPNCKGKHIAAIFQLTRPSYPFFDFETLKDMQGQMVVLESARDRKIVLRGELTYQAAQDQLLFLGTPWFGSMDQVRAIKLGLVDFAIHDPLIDLLHVLKTQELATEDIKALLLTVNQQKKALREERKALERLSLVAKANRHGVVFTDIQGHITWCNEGFSKMSGHVPEAAFGKHPATLLHGPSTDHHAKAKLNALFQAGMPGELELVMTRQNGEAFWANVKVQPLLGSDGQVEEFFAIIEDIQARKVAAQQLTESEGRLSTVIRNMPSGMLLENEQRRIVLANQEFCNLFSIPVAPELMVGADCASSALETMHLFRDPESFVQRIDEVLDLRLPVIGDILHLNDGRIFKRDFLPVMDRGQYMGHLWRYEDITERENYARTLRLQEEKYRNIIANMNLGLIEVGLGEQIQYANQSFLEMAGYTQEEVLGQKASTLLMEGAAKELLHDKMKLRKAGIADMYEVLVRNKQGQLRWWIISGAPNYDDEGQLIGSIGIHLDITAQKVMEHELELARTKAEASSRAKEAFLANMSHEIRTPLNAIVGVFREISRTALDQRQTSYLDLARTASDHLLDVINNVLDMSKIEAGELKIEAQHFSLQRVLDQVLDIVRVSATRKGLQLHAILAPELHPAYLGDALRIRQVLLNLLGNAIKFTEQGEVRVRCHVLLAEHHQHHLGIEVTDTGQGMEEEFLKRIFSKFSQEDETTARRYGGTGLGMAISRELIQLMGGRISAWSEKGRGTTISIQLPLHIGTPDMLETEAALAEDFSALHGKHILLAEDNPINRLIATATLTHHGIQLTEVENGLLAVEALQNQAFDLILMDVQMPEMDGLAATRKIRSFDTVTPIVALSANAFKREVDDCLAAGMNAYITKPFDENQLLQTILRLCVTQMPAWAHPREDGMTPTAAPAYNLQKIREVSRGSEEFVLQMVGLFLSELPRALQELEAALEKGDVDKMRKVAHRIKPSVEAMGMPDLHHLVRSLELRCADSAPETELRSLLDTAQATAQPLLRQLRQDFPQA